MLLTLHMTETFQLSELFALRWKGLAPFCSGVRGRNRHGMTGAHQTMPFSGILSVLLVEGPEKGFPATAHSDVNSLVN